MMVLLELFISFLKIGFTSFGGLSMIPLITSEMTSHGWMTAAEVSDIVAIAEMTPGPLGLNCATFAGMRTAGFLGAIAANLGTLSPTLTVCLLAAIFFERFRPSARTGARLSVAGPRSFHAVHRRAAAHAAGPRAALPACCMCWMSLPSAFIHLIYPG